jgi:predicted Zn-dependent protease
LPTAHLFRGASLLALDQPGPAAESLAKALAARPSDRNAQLMLAEARLALGQFSEAVNYFEALSRELTRNPRIWYGLARSYGALGRPELAAAAAEKLRMLPPSIQSHQFAAEDLEKRGTHAQAAREWRRALALAPDDFRIKAKLVWSLYRARDYEAALPLVAELRKAKPDSAELNFLHGASLLNQGRPREAIPYLESALRQDAGLLPNRAALGLALLQSGQTARAIPHLEAALEADQDGSYYYQLSRAYRAAGMHERARKALEDYQARQKRP